jgi:hypothetical protein
MNHVLFVRGKIPARDPGYDGPPFAWDEDRFAHLRAEFDAFYAGAYGMTRDDQRHILDPADARGPDYSPESLLSSRKRKCANLANSARASSSLKPGT